MITVPAGRTNYSTASLKTLNMDRSSDIFKKNVFIVA